MKTSLNHNDSKDIGHRGHFIGYLGNNQKALRIHTEDKLTIHKPNTLVYFLEDEDKEQEQLHNYMPQHEQTAQQQSTSTELNYGSEEEFEEEDLTVSTRNLPKRSRKPTDHYNPAGNQDEILQKIKLATCTVHT